MTLLYVLLIGEVSGNGDLPGRGSVVSIKFLRGWRSFHRNEYYRLWVYDNRKLSYRFAMRKMLAHCTAVASILRETSQNASPMCSRIDSGYAGVKQGFNFASLGEFAREPGLSSELPFLPGKFPFAID